MKPAALILVALLAATCSALGEPNIAANEAEQTAQSVTPVCPHCGAAMSSDALQCPECGMKFEQPAPPAPTTRRPWSGADLARQKLPIDPASSQELENARDRLRGIRSDMRLKRVLATLGLSRFKGHATKAEGPTTVALQLDLASDHILDLYYIRKSATAGWELSWVGLDEAFWYPAENKLSEAAFSRVDVREYGQSLLPPVGPEELASAKQRLKMLRPELNLRRVLATLGLSRCRGHFIVGSGSLSLSVHGDLGNGHKLDMSYDRVMPPHSPSGWTLSWVALDWEGHGAAEWSAAKARSK